MTKLNKPVRRETDIPAKVLGRDMRPIIVTLYPDGRIGLKQKGLKREYALDLSLLYNQAMIADAERVRAEKRKAKKRRGRQ